MSGKGVARRPAKDALAYQQGWERIWGEVRKVKDYQAEISAKVEREMTRPPETLEIERDAEL